MGITTDCPSSIVFHPGNVIWFSEALLSLLLIDIFYYAHEGWACFISSTRSAGDVLNCYQYYTDCEIWAICMSKSHSPSSSPTTPSPPSSPPAPKAHQRVREDIPPTSGPASGLRDETLSLRPIRTIDSTSSSQRRPPHLEESNPSDSHRAKRLRTESFESLEAYSSQFDSITDTPPTSSLSRNMGAQSEQPISSQTVAAAKKKRTRTLTTPHQAAVLYALLAQSRFPTTAMREEVGRSIGLSARKVQIWFQNQRQKARRPRSQTETNSNTAQPLSAFPSFPQYSASSSSSNRPETNPSLLPPLSSSSSSYQLQSSSAPESYSHLSDPPSQLLGPGVPGLDSHPVSVSRGGGLMSHTSHIDFGHPILGSSRGTSQVSPTQGQRLATTLSFPSHYQNPYRTLPPLAPDSQIGVSDSISRLGAQPAISQLPLTDTAVHPLSVELPFIHYRPTSNPPTTLPGHIVGSASMPPPFTLQPQPQWDARSFTPSLTRPGMWSTPSPSASSPSPTQPPFVPPSAASALTGFPRPGPRHSAPVETQGAPQPEMPSPPQQRMGRYDPVRATIVPLPKESSPHPPTPLPSRD